jgi:hypothetical protein
MAVTITYMNFAMRTPSVGRRYHVVANGRGRFRTCTWSKPEGHGSGQPRKSQTITFRRTAAVARHPSVFVNKDNVVDNFHDFRDARTAGKRTRWHAVANGRARRRTAAAVSRHKRSRHN